MGSQWILKKKRHWELSPAGVAFAEFNFGNLAVLAFTALDPRFCAAIFR